MLPGLAFVIALQRIAQVVPDGIIRSNLRHFFHLIHEGIHHIFERLSKISEQLFQGSLPIPGTGSSIFS